MKTFQKIQSRVASKPSRKPVRALQSRSEFHRVAWRGKRSITDPTPAAASKRTAWSRTRLSLARVPSSSGGLVRFEDVQFKLRVGLSTEPGKREADPVANRIMSMPKPYSPTVKSNWASSPSKGTMPLQRDCSSCAVDDHKEVGGKRTTDDDLTVLAKLKGSSRPVSRGRESEVRELKDGQRLPESERRFFEPRFGLDFSHVQLHTDSAAQASANSINA